MKYPTNIQHSLVARLMTHTWCKCVDYVHLQARIPTRQRNFPIWIHSTFVKSENSTSSYIMIKMGEIPLITDALEGDIANIYSELREQPTLEESRT